MLSTEYCFNLGYPNARLRFDLNFPRKCSLLNKHIPVHPFRPFNKYAQVPTIREFVSNLNLHFLNFIKFTRGIYNDTKMWGW